MQNANFRLKRDNMSSFNLLSVTQSLFRDCGIFLACFSYILFLTKRPLYSVFYKAATIVLNIISNLPMVFLLRVRDISSEYLNKTTTIVLSGFCWKNGFKNLFFFPGTQMAGAHTLSLTLAICSATLTSPSGWVVLGVIGAVCVTAVLEGWRNGKSSQN